MDENAGMFDFCLHVSTSWRLHGFHSCVLIKKVSVRDMSDLAYCTVTCINIAAVL